MIASMEKYKAEEKRPFKDPGYPVHGTRNGVPAIGVSKLNHIHEAMIDHLIAHPGCTNKEISEVFNYNRAYVSQLLACDAFRDGLKARRAGLFDPVLRMSIEEKFGSVIRRNLDIIHEKLQGDAEDIPDNFVVRTLEISTKALGMGNAAMQSEVSGDGDRLNKLAERLVSLQSKARKGLENEEAIEVEAREAVEGDTELQGSESLQCRSEERAIRTYERISRATTQEDGRGGVSSGDCAQCGRDASVCQCIGG